MFKYLQPSLKPASEQEGFFALRSLPSLDLCCADLSNQCKVGIGIEKIKLISIRKGRGSSYNATLGVSRMVGALRRLWRGDKGRWREQRSTWAQEGVRWLRRSAGSSLCTFSGGSFEDLQCFAMNFQDRFYFFFFLNGQDIATKMAEPDCFHQLTLTMCWRSRCLSDRHTENGDWYYGTGIK